MIEQFTSYFTKLERLSSDELDRSAEKLVLAENTSIAKLIAHLAEMSSRKVALELGYKNLFDYCVRRLNLSEGAVPARIHVANVSRRFPQLLVALAESRISLTVACLLAPHLSEDNVDKLISDCTGMTRKATEEYLVAGRSPSSSRRSASAPRFQYKWSRLDATRHPHRHRHHLHPWRHRRAPQRFCSPHVREFSTFAFPPTGISRTSSSDWPKC